MLRPGSENRRGTRVMAAVVIAAMALAATAGGLSFLVGQLS